MKIIHAQKILLRILGGVLLSVLVLSLSLLPVALPVFADTPPTVTNLTVINKDNTSATLKWNVSSVAIDADAVYDVRYSTEEITAATFADAMPASDAPLQVSDLTSDGTKRTYQVTDLDPGTTYFFAVETTLGGDTWSPISNVTSVKTVQQSNNTNNNDPYTTGDGTGFTTGAPTGNTTQDTPSNVVTLAGDSSTGTTAGNTSGSNNADGTAKPKTDNYTGLVKCSGVASGDNETECGFYSFISTVANLINWAFYLSLPVAVVLFSWAGILYLSGQEGKIEQARHIFLNVAVGFIIMLVAFTVVHTLVGWLVDPKIGAETLLSK